MKPKKVILKSAILTLSSLFVTIFSYAQLIANFTSSLSSGCSPLVVDFQDQSTGNPVSWAWDFGNGSTSTLKNPSTTYLKEGVYTVKLTIKNAQGTANTISRTNLITLYGKPLPRFSVSDSSGCFPVRSQFTDLSVASTGTTNTTWFWDFGDGTQSTEQNPLHAYTTSGSFAVTLKVTNDKGCYGVISKPAYINVTNGVTSSFTNSQAAVCKPPFSITFNATSTGSGTLSYLWDFGDGSTSTAQNPSHSYTTTGIYDVRLTTSSSLGCADTLLKSALINTQDIQNSFSAPATVCIYDSALFQNTSTPTPVSMLWNFGDGSSSTDSMPKKKYAAAGTYTVLLLNTYSYCKDTISKQITVAPKPVANFTADNLFKCAPPFTVNFQDQTGTGTSWQWNFGDSGTATAQNPSHTFSDFGYYSIQLIVASASGCIDTVKKDSLIKIVKPVITIPNLPARGCIPYTINPVAQVKTLDNVTSYLWDFGDGTTSAAQTPSHTFVNQGTYTVTLTITTSTGCTESLTIPAAVRVGTKPVTNFSVAQTTACAFQSLQFTDLTDVADEWLWDFGDGRTSTAQNAVHDFQQTGTFTVSLTATNNGCPVTFALPVGITVKPPIARYNVTANCANKLQFTFSDQSESPQSWFWDFGDGTTSNQQSPTHTFPGFNTYNVTLTVTNDTCSHSITKAIKVFDETPSISSTFDTICRGSTLYFTAVVKDPSNFVNYLWDFNDGHLWNSDDVDGTGAAWNYYSVAGSYTVRLTLTDIYGCKRVVTKAIRINGPTANFSANNNNGCQGQTTTFNDLSRTDGLNNISNWQWDFGDGNVQNFTGGPFQHIYADTGTFSVRLFVTDTKGCKDSITVPNLIHTTNPIASFASDTASCPGRTINFTNTSTGLGYTSQWTFGDGQASALAAPSHSYTDTGYYDISLIITDQYGCKDSAVRPGHVRIGNPKAAFVMSDSVSSCSPFEVRFNDSSYYAARIVWDLGGGSLASNPDPVRYYITPGTYQIQLIAVSPGGCTDTAFGTVRLYDTTGSRIDYLPLGGCQPLSVDLNTFTKGPVTYTWDFGDGVILNNDQDTINHIYNSFGDFVPTVIMTDPTGCTFPVTGVDTIHIIGALAKFGIDKKLLCDSGLINILDSTTFNDQIISYNWDFGDGSTSNLPNPASHYYAAPGIYTMSLNVTTENNCVDTFSLQNILKVVESPLVLIGGDSVICVNDPLQHLGVFQRADTSAVDWQWQFPNGNTSLLQNPVLQQYATSGTYSVMAIATNSSGCADSTTKNILVNPLPVITMPPSITKLVGIPLLLPATYTSNVISYNWKPAATLNCTDCPQPETSTKFNTKFAVAVVDSNGCRNTGEIQVIVTCPNANVFLPNTFSPNGDGSNDVFYVRGRGLDRVKTLRIFNRWGEVVYERNNFAANDPLYGWNGSYKGNKPHPDVYVYQVEVFCENSEVVRFEGNVALIQ